LSAEQCRLANFFLEFIGGGRSSQALEKALIETERRVESLSDEVDTLRRDREKVFAAPPTEWIEHRLNNLGGVPENRTARSVNVLHEVLGPIRLHPVTIGRPF
jgi:hypothetical protein